MEILLVGGHFDGETIVTSDTHPIEILRIALPHKPFVLSAENAALPTGDDVYMDIIEYRHTKCWDGSYIYKII